METALHTVKQLVLAELKHVNVRVYLFGSWARGEQRRSSDIDIAIDHQGAVSPYEFACIRDLVDESNVPYRVDVVDLTLASPDLARRIKEEGILWKDYASDYRQQTRP